MLSKLRQKSLRYRNYTLFQLCPWPDRRADLSDQEQKKEIEKFSKNHY